MQTLVDVLNRSRARPCSVVTALFFCASSLLCGCGGPKDAHYRPHELSFSGQIWPPDIVADKNTTGVFPGDGSESDTALCCWVAAQARFAVQKRAPAQTLRIGVYVPDVKPFAAHNPRITIRFKHFTNVHAFANLSPGFHNLLIELPKALIHSKGPVVVALHSTPTYAPLGAQGPQYGVLLVSAYFK